MDLIKQMQLRLAELDRERGHLVAYLKARGVGPQRGQISEQGLANIRAAQKARWAKRNGRKQTRPPMSAETKEKIRATLKKRWASKGKGKR